MKIRLLAVGKTENGYLKEGIEIYHKRLKHYCDFEIIELADVKTGKKNEPEIVKKQEGVLILSKIGQLDTLILLDEKGKQFTSREWSLEIEKCQLNSISNLVFVVGGAFGYSKEVYERSEKLLSFSKMTFSHQMIRLFFVEQLYRAFSIMKGEKYHND